MSDALEVGRKLVKLVREGNSGEAVRSLYAPDIVSVEAYPGDHQTLRGLEACLAKGEMFDQQHEIHSAKLEGPFPNGHQFVVFYDYDVTHRESGKRFPMREAAVYTVEEGKVIHEKFFYSFEPENPHGE